MYEYYFLVWTKSNAKKVNQLSAPHYYIKKLMEMTFSKIILLNPPQLNWTNRISKQFFLSEGRVWKTFQKIGSHHYKRELKFMLRGKLSGTDF